MRSNVIVKKYWCTMGVRFLIFSTFDQCIVVLPISNAEFVPQFVDMKIFPLTFHEIIIKILHGQSDDFGA